MKICSCQYCGVVFDFSKCVELYDSKQTYYGEATKCPVCGAAVFEEETSRVEIKFEDLNND